MALFPRRKAGAGAGHGLRADTDWPTPDKLPGVLHVSFGITLRQNSWVYYGPIDDSFAPQLASARACVAMLDELQAQLQLVRICIAVGSPTYLIVDRTPPLAIQTSLSQQEAARLVAAIIGRRKQVHEAHGAWLMQL